MTITNRLREIVRTKGMTFAELSRQSGVSYSVVYSAIRGAVPGAVAREKIEKALGSAPAELWGPDPAAGPHV
jgi:lambda repressor-like predicted transcriptional regulator